MTNVLLFGPKILVNKKAYGGGVGGYTRNMKVYLSCFPSEEIVIKPSYHTVRGEYSLWFGSLVIRLFVDIVSFTRDLITNRIQVVHILGMGGGAIFREFAIVTIASIFRKKILYELKAGTYIDCYNSGGSLYKLLQRLTIRLSDKLLVEGRIYSDFLKNEFGRDSVYFPNFVPASEIPAYHEKDVSNELIVLFVGYCYEGKGVYELVEAAKLAFENNINIKLVLVGEEHPDFSAYADKVLLQTPGLVIERKGRLDHGQVLEYMRRCHVYGYPTKHIGEGHNNSINEAMMNSMIIITSNHGFLPDILGDELAFHLDKVNAREIYDAICMIRNKPQTALTKARRSYDKLLSHFSSDVAAPLIRQIYREMASGKKTR